MALPLSWSPNPTGPLVPSQKATLDLIFGEDYCGNLQTSDMKRMFYVLGLGVGAGGGLAWEVGKPYIAGTVVTEGGVTYIAAGDHTSETGDVVNGSPTQPGQTQWTTVSVLERGGVAWDASFAYLPGDVVGSAGVVYVAVNANNSDLPPSVNWAVPATLEFGGRLWLTGNAYLIGDIVTGDDGLIYQAITDNTGQTPSTNLGVDWAPISAIEFGGRMYDAALAYSLGDIVVDDINGAIYINILAGAGAQPSTSPLSWEPLTVQERGGVQFDATLAYVSNDVVVDDLDNNLYRCLTPGAVTQPSTTPADWAPITTIELGGRLWDITYNYLIGDIITGDDGLMYQAITDNVGLTPSTNLGVDWAVVASPERGGVQFDATLVYEINDAVIDDIDNKLYRCLTAGAVTQPSTTSADWVLVAALERGGVLWETTIDYLIGDIVTDDIDGKMYKAIVDNVASQPSAAASTDWVLVNEERGGIWYKAQTDYQLGDIITADNGTTVEMYRCDVAYTSAATGLPADFLAEVANWTLLYVDVERGGVLWDTTINYLIGDIVTDDVDGKTYTAQADNLGSQPSTQPNVNWQLSRTFEKGGLMWNPLAGYDEGDVVSDATNPRKVFVSISLDNPNVNNIPPIVGSDAHWQLIDTIYYNSPTGGDRNGDGAWTAVDDGSVFGGGDHCPWDSTSGDVNPITPNAIGEYPRTAADPANLEEVGAIWRVSGLGRDINGDSKTWTFTGGTLAGMEVADNDTLTWVDGPTSTTPGDGSEIWLLTAMPRLEPERGGVLWRSAENYVIGDIVTDTLTGEVYVAIGISSGIQPSTSPGAWELARGEEIGGRFYKESTDYKIGDIITATVDDGVNPTFTEIYRCIANNTSAIGGAPTDFFAEIISWELVTADPERGGISWLEGIDYKLNDIVVDPTDLLLYRALRDHTSVTGDNVDGSPEQLTQTAWEVAATKERGGVAYDITTTYLIGDIVVDALVVPHQTYISLQDVNLNQPLPTNGTSLWWQEVDTIFYNSPTGGDKDGSGTYTAVEDGSVNGGTLHCPWDSTSGDALGAYVTPNALGEYPATDGAGTGTNEEIGATWYVSGLGRNGNIAAEYTFTAGNLAGVTVRDGDRLSWVGGLQGAEIWFHNPYPRVSGERGGVLWNVSVDYIVGDLVTDDLDSKVYRCVTDNVALQPSAEADETNWALVNQERGGISWLVSVDYKLNDLVVDPTDLLIYRALRDHTSITGDNVDGAPGELSQTAWEIAAAPERGGVLWNTATDYLVGDLVTDDLNSKVYRCVTDNIALQPSVEVDETNWIVVNEERGGVAWEATTNYAKGDMVVNLSDFATYKCIINDNLGNVPSDPWSGWERAIPDERGGLAWQTTIEYLRGDIVYDVVDDTPYVAIVATVTDQVTIPSQNLLEWKAITGTSGSMLTSDYRFSTLTAGDPTDGHASCNNADNTLADILFISILDEDNIDRTYGLETLTKGDYVSYRDKGNDPDTYIYRVTGDAINQVTYFEVPVVHHTSIGAGGLSDNEGMNIEVLYIAAEERGGIMVTLGETYFVGDIVTDDLTQEAYRCILDNAGTQPSTSPLDWVTIEPHGYIAETGTVTYTPDFTTDDFFDYTLTQDADLIVPTDIKPGDTGTIVIRQDAVGGWNPTWAPNYQWADGLPILDMNPNWVHIFEYNCISTEHVVMEYISDLALTPVAPTPPSVIADFAATDTLVNAVVMTWTDAIGLPTPTYDLYDSTDTLLVSGISSGYSYTYTGTIDFYVKAINTEGFADSNSESGTGVVVTTLVAITDFAATDAQTGYVEVTFTEQ